MTFEQRGDSAVLTERLEIDVAFEVIEMLAQRELVHPGIDRVVGQLGDGVGLDATQRVLT